MKISKCVFVLGLMIVTQAQAMERPDCVVRFASSTKSVPLKLTSYATYRASEDGYDFEAFLDKDQNTIAMTITKPADASGDRESISATQVKPKTTDGLVNLYLSNAKEQVTFLCKVRR